jgi:hypothetical protein
MPTRVFVAVTLCTMLALPGVAQAQGRGKGRGLGHFKSHGLGHLKGHGAGHVHPGHLPPGHVPFRGSVQGTVNRFLFGDHDHHVHYDHHVYDGYHVHVSPPRVRYYGFTIGLPYAFVHADSYYPGYYSYLYGPRQAVAVPNTNYGPGGVEYVGPAYPTPAEPTTVVAQQNPAGAGASLTAARSAFRLRRYRDAIVKAGEAAQARPDDPAPHELLSQAMFALGDYRGAAIEAHAVLHYGQPADWSNVARMYGDPADYTGHLRALESHVAEHEDDPAGVFLVGYQYKMLGHEELAAERLAQAIELAPEDRLARRLLDPAVDVEPAVPNPKVANQPRVVDIAPAGDAASETGQTSVLVPKREQLPPPSTSPTPSTPSPASAPAPVASLPALSAPGN